MLPGHRIASANASLALSGKPESVDLTLGQVTDTSFIVVGPDGRPAAGAVVEPYTIRTPYVPSAGRHAAFDPFGRG